MEIGGWNRLLPVTSAPIAMQLEKWGKKMASGVMQKLIGTWSFVSWERFGDGEHFEYPVGQEVTGLLTYTQSGFVQVQLMGAGRSLRTYRNPRDAANRALRGRPLSVEAAAELSDAYSSFAGYAGRFEVDEPAGLIRHHIITGVDPNMVGTTLERLFVFPDDGTLELRIKPYRVEDWEMTDTLTWSRMSEGAGDVHRP